MSCDHCGRWPLIMNHHTVKFSGYRSSVSGNITFLICQVTSRDDVIERICDFAVCGLLSYPAKFGSHRSLFLVMPPHVTTWSTRYVTLCIIALHQKPPACQFCSLRPRRKEEITFFIFHVITWPRDQRVRWLC